MASLGSRVHTIIYSELHEVCFYLGKDFFLSPNFSFTFNSPVLEK